MMLRPLSMKTLVPFFAMAILAASVVACAGSSSTADVGNGTDDITGASAAAGTKNTTEAVGEIMDLLDENFGGQLLQGGENYSGTLDNEHCSFDLWDVADYDFKKFDLQMSIAQKGGERLYVNLHSQEVVDKAEWDRSSAEETADTVITNWKKLSGFVSFTATFPTETGKDTADVTIDGPGRRVKITSGAKTFECRSIQTPDYSHT